MAKAQHLACVPTGSAFEMASFTAREASVPMPDLAYFFKDLEEGANTGLVGAWFRGGGAGHPNSVQPVSSEKRVPFPCSPRSIPPANVNPVGI